MDERALKILGFFDPAVLASYREQPDKYTITTDHFEGRVTVTSEYFAKLDDEAQEAEYIDVQFGYRTLKNGNLKIAAYLPDLVDHSPNHVDRWRPFLVDSADWLDDDQDERFSLWYPACSDQARTPLGQDMFSGEWRSTAAENASGHEALG